MRSATRLGGHAGLAGIDTENTVAAELCGHGGRGGENDDCKGEGKAHEELLEFAQTLAPAGSRGDEHAASALELAVGGAKRIPAGGIFRAQTAAERADT